MRPLICERVEQRSIRGRPYFIVYASCSERDDRQTGLAVEETLRRLRSREAVAPRDYPAAPVFVSVDGDSKRCIAEELSVTEISVGIALVELHVFSEELEPNWLVGKAIELSPVRQPASSDSA